MGCSITFFPSFECLEYIYFLLEYLTDSGFNFVLDNNIFVVWFSIFSLLAWTEIITYHFAIWFSQGTSISNNLSDLNLFHLSKFWILLDEPRISFHSPIFDLFLRSFLPCSIFYLYLQSFGGLVHFFIEFFIRLCP